MKPVHTLGLLAVAGWGAYAVAAAVLLPYSGVATVQHQQRRVLAVRHDGEVQRHLPGGRHGGVGIGADRVGDHVRARRDEMRVAENTTSLEFFSGAAGSGARGGFLPAATFIQ